MKLVIKKTIPKSIVLKVTAEGLEPSLTEPKSVVLSIKLCSLFIFDLLFSDCKNKCFLLKGNS